MAERLGHRRLGTGHVLLAMVDLAESEPDHDLASLFKEDGVDIAMVRQAVEAAVENEPDLLEIARVADVTSPPALSTSSRPPASDSPSPQRGEGAGG